MNNLLRFTDNLFCISDYETESLSLTQKNRPWSISWLICNNKEILEKHDYFIWWPDLNISDGAAKATGFNYEEYKKKAQPQEKVWEIWSKFLYNSQYIHTQHNGINFDQYITQIWRKELGLGRDFSFLNNYIDSNSLARMVKLGIKSCPRNEWLVNWFKFGNYVQRGLKTSLGVLNKELDINCDLLLHISGNDIILNQLILQKLIWKIDI